MQAAWNQQFTFNPQIILFHPPFIYYFAKGVTALWDYIGRKSLEKYWSATIY